MWALLTEVRYSPTITLGAAIIAALLGLAALYRLFVSVGLRSANEIQGRRIEALEGDIADKDRRLTDYLERLHQLGAEKDAATATAVACEATIETLKEQMAQMPKYEDVIAFGTEQMKAVNFAAAERQEQFVSVVVRELKEHDKHVEQIHQDAERRATERHEVQIRTLEAIVNRLA